MRKHLPERNMGTLTSYKTTAAELLSLAIKRVPAGNDYIILDRCAGIGDLEAVLETAEISHCVVSTCGGREYQELSDRLGGKVRAIIPPKKTNEYTDAMSREYINDPILQGYIQNPRCTIILYERPLQNGVDICQGLRRLLFEHTDLKKTYVYSEFMKGGIPGEVSAALANLYIWSGFKYFLRSKDDSYIMIAPMRCWHTHGILNKGIVQKKCIDGVVLKPKHTCLTAATETCILWSNESGDDTCVSLRVIAV